MADVAAPPETKINTLPQAQRDRTEDPHDHLRIHTTLTDAITPFGLSSADGCAATVWVATIQEHWAIKNRNHDLRDVSCG